MRNWRIEPTKEEQAEVHVDTGTTRPTYRQLHDKAVAVGMGVDSERTRINLHIKELKSADATLRKELAFLDTLPDGSEEDRLETVRNRSIEIGFDIHASEEELNGLPPSQADVIAEREAAGQQVIKLQEPK